MAELEEKYVSPWEGASRTVQLGEKDAGGKILEFGLDTAEVLGAGSAMVVQGSLNLAETALNEMNKSLDSGKGLVDTVLPTPTHFDPVEATPVMNIVPDDIKIMMAEQGVTLSDDKWNLAQAVALMTGAIGISSKLNTLTKVDDMVNLSSRIGTRIGTSVAGDVGANIITPDSHKGNILDTFGADKDGAFGWLLSEDEEDESKRKLNNLIVDAGLGVMGQGFIDSMVFLKRSFGASTKARTFRAQFASDVMEDRLNITLKEYVRNTVEGGSLMADGLLNKSKLDFTISPISKADASYRPTTVAQVDEAMRVDANNIQLKADKKLRDIDNEFNNQLRRSEDAKRTALDDLDKQEVQLKAELEAEGKALRENPLTSEKQMQKFEKKSGLRTEALEARKLKVVQEAEHDAKLIGDTQVSRTEALEAETVSKIQKNSDSYLTKKQKVEIQDEQAEALKDIDDTIHKQNVTDEEVDAVHEANKAQGVESTEQLSTEAKRKKNQAIKAKKVQIKEGIENHVQQLRRELHSDTSTLTEGERALAEKFVQRFDDGTLEVDNLGHPKGSISTRDEALDDVTHVLNYFGETVKNTKKTVDGLANFRYINKVLNEGVTDKFTESIDQLSKVTGLDRETLLINANAWGVVLEEATPLVTAYRVHLDKAIKEFHSEVKGISKRLKKLGKGVDEVSTEELESILHLKGVIESLHEGLGGVKSALGRGLKASGSAYGSAKFLDPFEQVRKNLNLKKPSNQAIKGNKQKETILNQAMKNLTPTDQKALQKFIHDMAKLDVEALTAKAIGEATSSPAFNELFLTNGLLGLIGKPSVLAGVAVSTLLQYGWDQIITKNIEAMASLVARNIGFVDSGIRFDNLARLQTQFDVMGDYFRYWWGDANARGSIGSTLTDYASRSTTQSLAEIEAGIRQSIGLRVGESYDNMTSKTITWVEDNIMAKPLSYSLMVNSRIVKGMEATDGLFRRLTIASEMHSQAVLMYQTKGGKAFFGDHLDQTTFVARFKEKGRRMMKLQDDLNHKVISQLEFTDKVTALFKGDEKLLDVMTEATQSAETRAVRSTFQETTEDTVAGNLLRSYNAFASGEGGAKMAMRWAGGMIVPFQKSPVNSMRAVAEHSPLAVTSLRFWKAMTDGTPAEKINALSKVIGGTTLMYGVYNLGMEGKITGSVEKGKFGETKANQRPPYSFLVGDKWWSYARGGMFKTMIATAIDSYEYVSSDPEGSKLSVMGIFMNATLNDSNFQGMTDMLEAVRQDDPSRFLEAMTRQGIALAEPVKGFTSDFSMLTFPTQVESSIAKEANGLSDLVYRTLANATKNSGVGVPARSLDAFGVTNVYDDKLDTLGAKEYRYDQTFTGGLLQLAGQKTTSLDTGEFRNQLLTYGVIKDVASPVDIYGAPLDSVMSKNFNRELMQGSTQQEGLLSELKRIFSLGEFKRRTPDVKQRTVDSIVARHKKNLQNRMYMSDDELRATADANTRAKVELGRRSIDLEEIKDPIIQTLYAGGSETYRRKVEADIAEQRRQAKETFKALGQ